MRTLPVTIIRTMSMMRFGTFFPELAARETRTAIIYAREDGEPGVLPAVTVTAPFWAVLTLPCVTATVMPVSNVGAPSVTVPLAEVIAGCRVAVPPAGTITVSGFGSHVVAGLFEVVPEMTNRVTLYLGSVTVAFQACPAEGTMLVGVVEDNV